jgi:hypothetical protein
MSHGNIQFNAGRIVNGGRGRGRGRGRGGIRFNGSGPMIGYNPNYYHQGFRQQNFLPELPPSIYQKFLSYTELTDDTNEDLKYPVFFQNWKYILTQLKRNSIITMDILRDIYPGEDERKIIHFKKIYCSPHGSPSDGLYSEFVKIIKDILE